MPRVTTAKHLTSDPAYQDDVEKIRRYTFLDKMTTTFGPSNRRGVINSEFSFPKKYNGLFSVKYIPDTLDVIASFGTGEIQIFNSTAGVVLNTVRSTPKRPTPIMCIRCVPRRHDDLFFAAGINGKIYKCRCAEGACELFAEEKQNEINSIDINTTSQYLVSGGKDATLRLYDVETGKLQKSWSKENRFNNENSTQFHTMRIFSVKFHYSSENVFLSGGWDKSVKIWDIRVEDSCIRAIAGPFICGDALDIKDKQVLTGSWTEENSIQLWDLTTSRLITNVNPVNRIQTLDGEFLYCCQFFKGTTNAEVILAAGSGIGQLEIISIKEEKILNSFRAEKTIQAIDSDEDSHIVYGGMNPTIKVIKF